MPSPSISSNIDTVICRPGQKQPEQGIHVDSSPLPGISRSWRTPWITREIRPLSRQRQGKGRRLMIPARFFQEHPDADGQPQIGAIVDGSDSNTATIAISYLGAITEQYSAAHREYGSCPSSKHAAGSGTIPTSNPGTSSFPA